MTSSDSSVCPVCGNSSSIYESQLPARLCACQTCGHFFTLMPQEHLEQYLDEYYDVEHKNWFVCPNTPLFERIASFLQAHSEHGGEQMRVLDVGCGRCDFLRYLHSRKPGYALTGIDLNPPQQEDIRIFRGDFLQVDTSSMQFDAVCSLATIEHVEEPHAVVAKMRSLLDVGGYLVMMTVDNGSLLYALSRLTRRVGLRKAFERLYYTHHLQHFSRASLAELLKRNGFDVVDRWIHNYPLGAVDVPQMSKPSRAVYSALVGTVFLASDILKRGMLQTVVARAR